MQSVVDHVVEVAQFVAHVGERPRAADHQNSIPGQEPPHHLKELHSIEAIELQRGGVG